MAGLRCKPALPSGWVRLRTGRIAGAGLAMRARPVFLRFTLARAPDLGETGIFSAEPPGVTALRVDRERAGRLTRPAGAKLGPPTVGACFQTRKAIQAISAAMAMWARSSKSMELRPNCK